MYEIIQTGKNQIENLLDVVKRDQLEFSEYRFLSDYMLKENFLQKSLKILENENSLSFTLLSGKNITALINCVKDEFDSEMFGFPCYRISDLIVLSKDFETSKKVVSALILTLEKTLGETSSSFYMAHSLNNNTPESDHLFNSLTNAGFYYIHTLLTFSSIKQTFDTRTYYPEENIKIRTATLEDVEAVSNLALKSFRYSRFHLDPFLDNKKAGILLKTSAENSIKKGFVDIMFVAERNGNVAGYYSAKKNYNPSFEKTIGNAVISAVDSEHRGVGIFSKMDSHLLNWFAGQTDFAEMGTYLANYPVHKTWINKGLSLTRGMHQFSKIIVN